MRQQLVGLWQAEKTRTGTAVKPRTSMMQETLSIHGTAVFPGLVKRSFRLLRRVMAMIGKFALVRI